jgi:hypothetical protein
MLELSRRRFQYNEVDNFFVCMDKRKKIVGKQEEIGDGGDDGEDNKLLFTFTLKKKIVSGKK